MRRVDEQANGVIFPLKSRACPALRLALLSVLVRIPSLLLLLL